MKRLLFLPLMMISFVSMAQLDTPYGLDLGDDAPLFTAFDVNSGEEVSLENYLERGPVLLVFYRGEWCKFCNEHLFEIEQWRPELEASGMTIMAVSPETTDNVRKTIENTKSSYIMISDNGYEIMESYDVDFTLDAETLKKYKKWDIDLKKANGDDSNTLTVPATYLIGQDGKIIYAHFTEDYKERSSMEMLVEAYHESEEGADKLQSARDKNSSSKNKNRKR